MLVTEVMATVPPATASERAKAIISLFINVHRVLSRIRG